MSLCTPKRRENWAYVFIVGIGSVVSKEPWADGADVGGCTVIRVQRLETVDILAICVGGTNKLGQSADDG